jgi:hypothetical protein
VERDGDEQNKFTLSWDRPTNQNMSNGTAPVDSLIKYAIYRIDSATSPDALASMDLAMNLIDVTGLTTYTDIAPVSTDKYWYFITAVTRNNVESTPTSVIEGGIVVSNENESVLPSRLSLNQNYPNPFNPTTTISFNLPETGDVTLTIYDLLGRKIANLIDGRLLSGEHSFNFDGSGLSSGVYIYKLQLGNESLTRKMLLLK